MAKLTGSAPVLLVKDVAAAAEYFSEKVGFRSQRLYGDPPYFAIVSRDGFSIMLAQPDKGKTSTPYWQIVDKLWNAYFWVDDAEALYAEMIDSGANIDYTLYTTPYGVKEFGIQDLDDHDIGFGQVVRESE